MKNYLFLILFLICNVSFSQEIKEVFNGEIHSVTKKVFNDMDTYLEDVNRYLTISDSLTTIRYNKDPNGVYASQFSNLEDCLSSNRMINKIRLDPDFIGEDWRRLKSQRWIFTDAIISMYTTYGKPALIDRFKALYTNRLRYTGVGTNQVPYEYKFTHDAPISIEIDNTDVKTIAGITCVKALVIYNDKKFEKINYATKKARPKVIYEMYVTDEIKTKFNPFIRDLDILNSFYPMYVKKYATAFRGRYEEHKVVTVAKENVLDNEKMKVSYDKLKDSLLSVYKTIVNIEKNKNSAPIFKRIKKTPVPFKEQLNVLEDLGYKLNPKVTLKDIERQLISNGIIDTSKTSMEAYFSMKSYDELYYYMGWRKYDKVNKKAIPYTGKCIWYDLEFIDPSSEYMTLMKRMGEITHGELSFTDMSISVDDNSYQWISFKVNGIAKKWKLQKVNYIDDSFFTRFADLTYELKTNGFYTYFENDSQQFVIDFATPSEQKEFIKKTGLQREWLTGGKHFAIPKD